MRHSSYVLALFLLVALSLAGELPSALGGKASKAKATKNSTTTSTSEIDPAYLNGEGKIDLTKADPEKLKIDLAIIDLELLDLSKEKVKQIDLSKWDLSKIDVSKVKDPLSSKWIQKVLKERKATESKLSKYAPGELERLQKQNLKWIQEPAPFQEPHVSRDHKYPNDRIAQAARAIDEVLTTKLSEVKQKFNPPASDEQFVRRIYLDVAGRIPTAQEAIIFINDKSPTKRRQLIDRLLLSPDYPSQMFNWAADMMRVRELKGNQGDNSAYQGWLLNQFAGNRSWSQTVHDLLAAEGDLVTNPAVGWLVRDGGMPLDSLSNTLTVFMGAAVGCAQCHDHPFNEYTQRDFYELAAFFGSTEIPGDNVRGAPKVLKDRYHYVATDPQDFLTFPKDYKYSNAQPGSRVTPRFPTPANAAPRRTGPASLPLGRKDFADWLTNKKNEQFAATIANRLWGKAFGRAVVEPMTEMDDRDHPSDERPFDPHLIKAIAVLMQELDFDLMAFQRVIYNTRAYQAQASISPDVGEAYLFPGPMLRRMTATQTWDSFVTLTEGDRVNESHRDRWSQAWSFGVLKDGIVQAIKDTDKDKRLEFDLMIAEADKLSSRLLRELHGGKKEGKSAKRGPTLRASELSQPEAERHFLRQFGQSDRELADSGSLEGGVPQALMIMNGDDHEMLAKSDSYIKQAANRFARTEAEQIDFMYLSFLGRHPTSYERNLISGERIGLSDLTWVLMNSREFMFIQ